MNIEPWSLEYFKKTLLEFRRWNMWIMDEIVWLKKSDNNSLDIEHYKEYPTFS